jgi:hypothetical protein
MRKLLAASLQHKTTTQTEMESTYVLDFVVSCQTICICSYCISCPRILLIRLNVIHPQTYLSLQAAFLHPPFPVVASAPDKF